MTHRQWNAEITRLLKLGETRPAVASRGLHRLAAAVDRSIKSGVQEWHAMQCRHLASMAEAASGDYQAAAATMTKVVVNQKALLTYEHRAYVSACAAAAIELMKAGDRNGARRMIQAATPWGKLLRPADRLLQLANKVVRTHSKGNKKKR